MNVRRWSWALLAFGLYATERVSALTYPSGTVANLYFSGETNFAVRVSLNGVTDPCGNGGPSFAFINAADSNYKVYVAGLMLAKPKEVQSPLWSSPTVATPANADSSNSMSAVELV